MARHLAEVLRWSGEVALVSRRDPASACERLLRASLELDAVLAGVSARRIVDIGSGAGFPGLVWACLHAEARILLVERRARKAAFLERTARVIGLPNVDVFAGDLRDVARDAAQRGAFDLAVSMAVGHPRDIVHDVQRVLVPRGHFASTLARDSDRDVGDMFHVKTVFDGDFGRYAVYQLRI